MRRVHVDVEPNIAPVDDLRVEQRLEPGVQHRAEIRFDRAHRRARARRKRLIDQRVLTQLVVVRELEIHAAAHPSRVEARLELRRLFRTQIGVAE